MTPKINFRTFVFYYEISDCHLSDSIGGTCVQSRTSAELQHSERTNKHISNSFTWDANFLLGWYLFRFQLGVLDIFVEPRLHCVDPEISHGEDNDAATTGPEIISLGTHWEQLGQIHYNFIGAQLRDDNLLRGGQDQWKFPFTRPTHHNRKRAKHLLLRCCMAHKGRNHHCRLC